MGDRVSTTKLRATWESAASGWAKWGDKFSRNLQGATNTLLDHANISKGTHVLDLACGAGSQTILAAERVGKDGRVVACDISEEMLKHVRENADRAGLENVETLRSAVEDLTTSKKSFAAAISRLGLMLFASPQNALSAIQSALKPGARMAALVFTTPETNSFMAAPMAILLRHGGKPSPTPGQPGIFALGGAGILENLLGNCGYVDVKSEKVLASLHLASADDALEMMQQAFGAYRAVIADLSDDAKGNAWAEVRDFLRRFEADAGFETEFEFIIGSGAVPE